MTDFIDFFNNDSEFVDDNFYYEVHKYNKDGQHIKDDFYLYSLVLHACGKEDENLAFSHKDHERTSLIWLDKEYLQISEGSWRSGSYSSDLSNSDYVVSDVTLDKNIVEFNVTPTVESYSQEVNKIVISKIGLKKGNL
ncbi:hypothetical protein wVul_0131 [Wolbachia endosymbiont of Armadillidium vulgare str. wVulC]|uniref:hypothetical protein n=1 Tax=Wolbachia endosymbiont of Armadillidium vulgare TaxID=77039 RepID=UPI00064B20F4|nr:hypothetical protein [Wolbachia endosymbiont of Armadillidium vulgare]KLT22928.1 hypothetical protein wVul_0131 [Wolbachia endosymbiont of Armadillidium vulgare str. wVulC]OJH31603.1 hypothetical protein Wxf_00997 [Wolbachia endosymbiont of Armadillidium vulgare]OJH32012.1 hypothetical protein Wxf_01431 [Wolbachia endosymbiont of Armadillidium vulgare]OJH32569.1 hypothetical protein Wxf_02011 [Wolbachia endosymbiont of Armadillidium vulgare]OJH33191.1 hypothetical protein Wxf_02665 [Wolbach